ncbi:MAG: aldehyde ferredoxin oxidoreductase family protein [Spirochaetota bacterium]
MSNNIHGYHGVILEINLTSGKSRKRKIPADDIHNFIGGRGLGMRILWDELQEPGIDPLSPQNPLLFMAGPFSGFPIPSASRTCVVTKNPRTSPEKSKYANASTVAYSNMGGFFGPEIRFAGYDGIMIKGKSSKPVYITIDDDRVSIEDAGKYWGMGTDSFDRTFKADLGDRGYESCYIGPAGENLVPFACIINTAARAAGRAGTGCIMGSKNLKAIAVKGSRAPSAAEVDSFNLMLNECRQAFKGQQFTKNWREDGTAAALVRSSNAGTQAVKNYREGTFKNIKKIGAEAAKKNIWKRDFACYCCPLSCKKSGVVSSGRFEGLVHDGPEYETGTMMGADLMIDDMAGMLKLVYLADDYGIDTISAGNVIGFLMEAYEKKLVDKDFLDGIDLTWGNVDASIDMLKKITMREGIGDLAAGGVRPLSEKIGNDTASFAIHVKGHELAAWNVHADPPRGISYVSSNRGACHLNGKDAEAQNTTALYDSLGLCLFAKQAYPPERLAALMTTITGKEWKARSLQLAGERVFNLEKMFNYREGFRRKDDVLPGRFYDEPLTMGPEKGAVLKREGFTKLLDEYYQAREWSLKDARPKKSKLRELGLSFTMDA